MISSEIWWGGNRAPESGSLHLLFENRILCTYI